VSKEVVADPYSFAMTSALHALAPRAKSRAELFEHLKKRGVESDIAASVLDDLELQGFLNDLEFANIWSESRQRQKKLSKRVIAGELRTKGVAQDVIDEVIAKIDDETEYQRALELAEKKFRSCAHLEPEKVYSRIAGVLTRKGYSAGLASQIVRELLGSAASN
jgi:regulatory protein